MKCDWCKMHNLAILSYYLPLAVCHLRWPGAKASNTKIIHKPSNTICDVFSGLTVWLVQMLSLDAEKSIWYKSFSERFSELLRILGKPSPYPFLNL